MYFKFYRYRIVDYIDISFNLPTVILCRHCLTRACSH